MFRYKGNIQQISYFTHNIWWDIFDSEYRETMLFKTKQKSQKLSNKLQIFSVQEKSCTKKKQIISETMNWKKRPEKLRKTTFTQEQI